VLVVLLKEGFGSLERVEDLETHGVMSEKGSALY